MLIIGVGCGLLKIAQLPLFSWPLPLETLTRTHPVATSPKCDNRLTYRCSYERNTAVHIETDTLLIIQSHNNDIFDIFDPHTNGKKTKNHHFTAHYPFIIEKFNYDHCFD